MKGIHILMILGLLAITSCNRWYILDYFENETMSSELIDGLYYASIDTLILKHIKNETAVKFGELLEKTSYPARKQELFSKIEERKRP